MTEGDERRRPRLWARLREHPFAEIAAVAYERGLLAIGTRAGRGRDAKLHVRVRGSDLVNLAEEHEVAVIAEG